MIREMDMHFFAKEAVRTVCSDFKQNLIWLLTGGMGLGKSYTALQFALICSQLLAKRLGGKPEDYFNMENIAIMNMEDVVKVYEKMKTTKHGVFIIDDASPVMSARRFQKDTNQAQNDMLVTMRPNMNILVISTPQKFLIDKVPRQLSGYIGFMKKPMHNIGINCVDIRKIDPQPDGRTFMPYLQNQFGEKYKLHTFRKPPEDWCEQYDLRRQKSQDALAEKSVEVLLQKPESKKSLKKDLYKKIYNEYIDGVHKELTLSKICQMYGVDYQSVKNMAREMIRDD